MHISLSDLTIRKAHEALKNRQFSAVELANEYLAQIKKKNSSLNAYLEVYPDVIAQAEAVDTTIRNSSRIDLEKKMHPLAGIPIALKDNILVKGRTATSASKILDRYRATYDATVVARLRACDALLIGRSNMDEFAMGGSNENSAYGPVKNPHDVARVPGGSSGGSAAIVAADMALAALGSDTGGSVRQPASFCGVVGLKPTYGRVSRSGLMAMASSLDQIGPLAKTVDDARIMFHAIAGKDPLDGTSYTAVEKPVLDGPKKIGVPYRLLEKGIDPDVRAAFDASLEGLKARGHQLVPIELPYAKYALPVYYIIMPAESSTNLSRFDGVRFGLHKEAKNVLDEYMKTRGAGFGREVRRRIILGTYVLSAGYYDAYYKKAVGVRSLIVRDFEQVFGNGVDVIATPTSPVPAFKIGERSDDPLAMYLADIFTVTANIAGIPAISVPGGAVVRDGVSLPVGLQLMGARDSEELLFAIGEEVYAG